MLIKVNDSGMIGAENGSRFTLESVALPDADAIAAPTPTVATIAAEVCNNAVPVVVAVETNGKEDMDATSSSSPSPSSSAAASPHLILAQWIEDTVGEPLAAKDNLWCSLKSGVVLCKLVNKIKPGTIARFNDKPPQPQSQTLYHARDNLGIYLKALKQLGMKQDLFEVPDARSLAAQQKEGDGERRREVLLQGILQSVRALQVLAKSQSKSAATLGIAPTHEVAAPVHHEVVSHAAVHDICEVALPIVGVARHDAVHPKAPITPIVGAAAPIHVSAPPIHNVAAAVARLQPQQQKKKGEEAVDDDFARNRERALRGAVMLSVIEEEKENAGDDHIDDDDINGLRARLTAKEKELEEFQGQLQQIHDLISPLMARKQQAEEELECAIQVCGRELSAKDAELEELRQQLQQRDSALASKEAEIQLLRAAIDEAQAQAQAAIAEDGEGVVDQDISKKKNGEPFAAVATTTTPATAAVANNNNNNDIIADGKVREEYEEDEAMLRRADQERACLRQQLAEARDELASAHAELLGVVSAKDSELRELQAQLQQMMIKMVKVDEMEQNKQSRAHQEAEELSLRAKDREIQLQDLKLWRAEAAERAAKRELAKSERAREELSEKLAAIFKEEQQEEGEVGDGEQDFLLDDDSIFASPPPSPSSLSPSLSSCSLASPSSSSSSLSSSPSSLSSSRSSSRSSSPSSLSSSSSPSLSPSRSSSRSSSSLSSAASAELNKEQKKKGKKKRLSSWLRAVVRRGGELADSLTSSTS